MSKIEINPLRSEREKHLFMTYPWRIYRRDPLWVPPLLSERAKTIDPQRGAFFKKGGEAEFFITWRNGVPVGTICAAEDKFANDRTGRMECMWGFFECIDDYDVAVAMWEHVIAWAKQRGLKSLYGPFNLDYEDSYGVLVEGRDRPPVMLCGHTPPYYLDFVERFGFEPARGQNLAFAINISEDTKAFGRLRRIAERVRKLGPFTIRSADFELWDEEVDNLLPLMNSALAHLEGHTPWHQEALSGLLQPFRQIADPQLIIFAEEDGRVIGFFPGIPNLNEMLIHANGLRHPWNYLKAWWYSRRQPDCLTIKSVLVYPEYWSTGVAVLMFEEMLERAQARGYQWVDLSLTAEDNPKTPMLAERMGGEVYKRYQVYRYLI
jgi:GNAT superfamily N-acetyltransferase